MSPVTSADRRGPVVVGVSGSPESERAVNWGADYAAASHRDLLLVHAVEHGTVSPSAEDVAESERAATETGRPVVDAALRRAAARQPDLTVAGAVEAGDPPSVLLAHAAHAAAVVVGARGGGVGSHLRGSVSLAVARHAGCPAVVVRPSGEAHPGRLGERVVLGVDGSRASRAAAEFAFAYADLTELPLVILHGSWERLARGSAVLRLLGSEEHGPTDEERLTIAETIAGLPERFADVEFRDAHRSSDPAKALIDASESSRLVVVGARHLSAAGSLLLRSVSTSLVEHAHCPVAVVHEHA